MSEVISKTAVSNASEGFEMTELGPRFVTGYVAFGLVYLGWAVATEAWNAWVLFVVCYGI